MTEKEAIKVLKRLVLCGICTTGPCEDCERKQAKDAALSALEEIRQYREIGTVEECREAMERRKAKEPVFWGDGCDKNGEIIYDMYDCPNCGKGYEMEFEEYMYCPDCGQAMKRR